MAAIKSIELSSSKWVRRASVATPDYQAGVRIRARRGLHPLRPGKAIIRPVLSPRRTEVRTVRE